MEAEEAKPRMGRYDDISDYQLRAEVARFARILQRMEDKDELLDRTADVLTLLGELRQMVFAWQMRRTYPADPAAPHAPQPPSGGG